MIKIRLFFFTAVTLSQSLRDCSWQPELVFDLSTLKFMRLETIILKLISQCSRSTRVKVCDF